MKIGGDSIKVTHSLFQEKKGGAVPTSSLQLKVSLLDKKTATQAYKQWHYFGEKGFLATYNFGVFFGNEFLGAISYGIPNARNIKGYYDSFSQKYFLELTRFALSEKCPKNSESRIISITLKMVKNIGQYTGYQFTPFPSVEEMIHQEQLRELQNEKRVN